jgi:hypothetical protein
VKSPTLVSAVLLVAGLASAANEVQTKDKLSETEKWVLQRISKGYKADLDEHYKGKPEKHILSADFLKQLVTGELTGHKLSPAGTHITGGIVRDEFDISGEIIPQEVLLVHFKFVDNVSCTGTKFDDTISFEESTIEGDLSLNGAKLGNDCTFTHATLKGQIDFTEADIRGQLVADGAHFVSETETCNFNGMTVRDLASFDSAEFYGPVDFNAAILLGNLDMDNARFKNKKEGVDFSSMKIGDTLRFNDTEFENSADFSYSDIKNQFLLDNAKFRNSEKEIDFDSVKVAGMLSMDDAVFEGAVDFYAANVGATLSASNIHFNNKTAEIDLSNTVIGRDAYFVKATFEGGANFMSANIGVDLDARETKFKNANYVANFNSAKIGNRVFLRKAIFDGGVSFTAGSVGDSFEAQDAQFNNPDRTASFNTLKVGRTLFLTNATFNGPVDLILAEVESVFDAEGAKFASKDREVTFNSMRMKSSCNIQKAIFSGEVDFTAAEIGMDFQADGTQFKSPTKNVFLAVNCARKGLFRNVQFAGPTSFRDSTFSYLVIDVSTTSPVIPSLDMSRAFVHRQFELKHAKIHELVAPFLHVEGSADLTDLEIDKSANLAYGDFVELNLSGSKWPEGQTNSNVFQIQGMTYKTIQAGPTDQVSHENLMDLADQAAFTSEVYGSLEQFFSRQGYNADADKVFIKGKVRERKQYLQGLHWLGSWMLYLLTGYGRHPIYVGGLCMILVALGCGLFSKDNMELQKRPGKGDPTNVYNAFWYSLGLFLPFVDLRVDKLWKPKQSRTILRNYLRIHILLGWILIPILVAALTGLIK